MDTLPSTPNTPPKSDDEIRADVIEQHTATFLRRTAPLTVGMLVAGGISRRVAERRVERDQRLRKQYETELA